MPDFLTHNFTTYRISLLIWHIGLLNIWSLLMETWKQEICLPFSELRTNQKQLIRNACSRLLIHIFCFSYVYNSIYYNNNSYQTLEQWARLATLMRCNNHGIMWVHTTNLGKYLSSTKWNANIIIADVIRYLHQWDEVGQYFYMLLLVHMTSQHGKNFHIISPLCGQWWIPCTQG